MKYTENNMKTKKIKSRRYQENLQQANTGRNTQLKK